MQMNSQWCLMLVPARRYATHNLQLLGIDSVTASASSQMTARLGLVEPAVSDPPNLNYTLGESVVWFSEMSNHTSENQQTVDILNLAKNVSCWCWFAPLSCMIQKCLIIQHFPVRVGTIKNMCIQIHSWWWLLEQKTLSPMKQRNE